MQKTNNSEFGSEKGKLKLKMTESFLHCDQYQKRNS